MRAVLYLALFLASSASAGAGHAQSAFDSLDSNLAQLDQCYNLNQSDVEDLDEGIEGINAANHFSPLQFKSCSHSLLHIHCYTFEHSGNYSFIRAPPVLLPW